MKRIFFLITGFLLIVFNSCKKESSDNSVLTESAIITKANKWLDSKSYSTDARKSRIKVIKDNLDYSASYTELLNSGDELLVIPLKSGFVSNINRDKKTVTVLLLTIDKSGNTVKGNLVQYQPTDKSENAIPLKSFSQLFNDEKVTANGSFTFLSIFDKYLYEVKYENGHQASFAEMKPQNKSSGTKTNSEAPTCTDWYLVTIYYDEYGYEIYREEEYIGTVCIGSCQPNELCDQLDDGGGGSGGTNQEDYEYEVSREFNWTVYSSSWLPLGSWEVNALDRVKAKRNSSEPGGGHFTGITNIGSYCTNCASYGISWNNDYKSTSFTDQSASCHLRGHIYGQSGNPDQFVDNTNTYSVGDVLQ